MGLSRRSSWWARLPNLHSSGSNRFNGGFGLTAGVAEAPRQSHADEISLLSALPTSSPDGSVRGLRARGGFEVTLRWRDGRLNSAEIRNSNAVAATRLRYGARTVEISFRPGEPIRLVAELTSVR